MRYHILFYSTLLYFVSILQCQVLGLQNANNIMYNKMDGMHTSVMTEHQTVLACETGTLYQYQLKKRQELLGK